MDREEFVDLVGKRIEFLDLLRDEPLWKRDIIERLDASRSTVNRAIKSLEDADLVERTGDGYATSAVGKLALERCRSYRAEAGDLAAASDALASLPPNCDLDVPVVAGSEPAVAAGPAPYRPTEQLHEAVVAADEYHAVLPALDDARHLRLLYEHVVTHGGTADVVVSPDLRDTLRSEFPQRMARMAGTDRFRVRVGEVPPYGLVRTATDDDVTVWLVVFGENDAVSGVLRNEMASAVAWADEQFDDARDDAVDVTESLRRTDTGSGVGGTSMTATLDAQGFVELGSALFAERATADPVTAWRAGLDLAEVHAGYAIDRTVDVDGERRSLTAQLDARLRAGTDCVLLGPPGCGKSTTCKQVACEWYGADRGPVFYRSGSRGRRFDAVDDLVAAVTGTAGHALVVVEDAVRPDARAVFDAVAELGDRDDVSFLFDARESEWVDQANQTDAVDTGDRLTTVTMPSLDRDCERLVEHVADTVDAPVDVPVEELREEVRGESPAGSAVPGDALLILHRVIRYVDPLDDGATTLEADVRSVYEALRDQGEAALDAGVLVNLLNAAGIQVDPGLAAVVEATDDELDAALDVLDGHVLFPRNDAETPPRTIHEAWSAAFLNQLVAADDAEASRIGRCLAAYLALADDADRRVAVRRAGADPGLVDAIDADPAAWVTDQVEQVFGFVELNHPKFAPALGSSDDELEVFPDACPERTRLRAIVKRGHAYRDCGRLDAAELEFRTVLDAVSEPSTLAEDDALRLDASARRGLGKVAHKRGAFDEAIQHHETAMERFRAVDAETEVIATYVALSATASGRGDNDALESYATQGLELVRELDDDGLYASLTNLLGSAKWATGELDAAVDLLETSIEAAESAGDRRSQAMAYSHLGLIERERGAFEDAVEYFRHGVERYREIGARRDEALDLWNLGEVARRRGDLDTAEEYLDAALERYREIDATIGVARTRVVQGELALDRGDADAAERLGREALEVLREHDELVDRAGARLLLAGATRRQGDLNAAEIHLEHARELCDDIGQMLGEVWELAERGRLERARGNLDDAEQLFADALDIARENGYRHDEAELLEALGELAVERGRFDAARERFAEAVERHEACGAPWNALAVLDSLVEACEAAGDVAAATEWCERAETLAADAGLQEERERFAARRADTAERRDAMD